MHFVSDFADGAVLLPAALAVAAVAAVVGWWRGLLAWVGVVASVALVTVALKTACLLFAAGLPDNQVFSASGHVAGACVVYGGLAVMLGRSRAYAVVPVAIAIVVGQARMALDAHSLSEVLAGAAIGCAGAWLLPPLAGPRPRFVTWPAAAVVSIAAVAFHGVHLNSEPALQHVVRSW